MVNRVLSFDEFINSYCPSDEIEYLDDYAEDELLIDIYDEPINYEFIEESEIQMGFTNHGKERLIERDVPKSKIEAVLSSCKMKLNKLAKDMFFGKEILIRSVAQNVSMVGKLKKESGKLKFFIITVIQGIGLEQKEGYQLIQA